MSERHSKIYEEYLNPDNRVEDIAKRYNITTSYVTQVATRLGAEPRRPRGPRGGNKQCPKCRKKIQVKGAKFCCFCGADIRSSKDILIERIDKARTVVSLLPESARDEVMKLFTDMVTELKKESKV